MSAPDRRGHGRGAAGLTTGVVLANEFAAVRLSIDRRGNAPRLRIDDLEGDRVVFLDAFELSALVARSAEARAGAMAPHGDGTDE